MYRRTVMHSGFFDVMRRCNGADTNEQQKQRTPLEALRSCWMVKAVHETYDTSFAKRSRKFVVNGAGVTQKVQTKVVVLWLKNCLFSRFWRCLSRYCAGRR